MNFASPTTHQLGFARGWPCKVQSPYGASSFVLRDARLDHFDVYTMRRKLISAPGTGKKTPLIFQAFKLDDIGIPKSGFSENQATLLNFDDSILCMNPLQIVIQQSLLPEKGQNLESHVI